MSWSVGVFTQTCLNLSGALTLIEPGLMRGACLLSRTCLDLSAVVSDFSVCYVF